MSDAIPAIFDSGVFRPLEPVNWPEGTRAEVMLAAPYVSSGITQWPTSYFEQTSGAFADEPFDRPRQGDSPIRENW